MSVFYFTLVLSICNTNGFGPICVVSLYIVNASEVSMVTTAAFVYIHHIFSPRTDMHEKTVQT
jgi:hypothetical protein